MTRYRLMLARRCLGRDYKIADETGHDVFYVDARAFGKTQKLSFQTMSGMEVASITETPPTYEITRDGRRAAVVKKNVFSPTKLTFTVDVPGPDDLVAIGEFESYEYAFKLMGREVARVSKSLFQWEEGYGVEIEPDEDEILILAAAVVIDLCANAWKK